jgi:hypothetical protein
MFGYVHVYEHEHVHVISSKVRPQVSFASLPWGERAKRTHQRPFCEPGRICSESIITDMWLGTDSYGSVRASLFC